MVQYIRYNGGTVNGQGIANLSHYAPPPAPVKLKTTKLVRAVVTTASRTPAPYANTFNDIEMLAQWYGGLSHTRVDLPGSGNGADYLVVEGTYTFRVPTNWTPRTVYTPVNVPYVYPLPGRTPSTLPGEAVGLTPCAGPGAFVSICATPRTANGSSGNGGAMIRPFQDYYKSTIYQNEKWRPVTVAVSYIYARNGASFVAVSAGLSTGKTDEPESSGSAALRWGYFNTAEPLGSDEIDKELTGNFTEVGVSVNGFQTAVVRNSGSHGTAVEIGKEVAFPDEPFGAEVLSGTSRQISGP
jgi:hypothetical protein